uniref:Uncharacterized protein n=1 Tax=Anguilla anguilla TaxID=7936 RepID=A0A0E9TSY1_ANGAN
MVIKINKYKIIQHFKKIYFKISTVLYTRTIHFPQLGQDGEF